MVKGQITNYIYSDSKCVQKAESGVQTTVTVDIFSEVCSDGQMPIYKGIIPG